MTELFSFPTTQQRSQIMERLKSSIIQPQYSNAFCSSAATTLAFVLLYVHVLV